MRARLALLIGVLLLPGCSSRDAARGHKVIVVGVDGMDPGFVERHWTSLPNLAKLRDSGSFSRLETTTPPQSPVAWSTVITGLDPSQHGIFDFVHRDPSTMQPFLSMDRTEPPRLALPLGPFELPLIGSRVVSLRRGIPFWKTLVENGIPVTIIRMPTNYPPVKAGRAIAGMGVPDLQGTEGTFSFFTDDPDETTRAVSGGVIRTVQLSNGRVLLPLDGPADPLRKDHAITVTRLIVDVDAENPVALITAGAERVLVQQGEWSDWMPVEFPLIPHVTQAHGMVRIYAKQLHPRFELYVSPVNVDPLHPDLPISAPQQYGREVAEEIGRFSTLGIPQDTNALRQGVFDLSQFLGESRLILQGEERMLDNSLAHFGDGFLFFYFSSVDQNSHMLWGKYDDDLLGFYRAVDGAIGRVMKREPAAELIVMSDHGFTSFTRAVNLNAWLRDHGFLQAKPDGQIDWKHTRVYALGLNGLYLNLAGREEFGVVHPGPESRELLTDVRKELLAFRDPDGGGVAVETLDAIHATPGDRRVAPDAIVGYARGYRASWQTALGEVPATEIEDNDDPWIGDHCINAADVPAVLFADRPLRVKDPALRDLAVTILGSFGIAPAADLHGRKLY